MRFNAQDGPRVLLISRVGTTGLNMSRANHIVIVVSSPFPLTLRLLIRPSANVPKRTCNGLSKITSRPWDGSGGIPSEKPSMPTTWSLGTRLMK